MKPIIVTIPEYELLRVLRSHRHNIEAGLRDKERREYSAWYRLAEQFPNLALDSLTEKERWQITSVEPGLDTYKAYGYDVPYARHVDPATFIALKDLGLAETRFGRWRAVFPSPPVRIPPSRTAAMWDAQPKTKIGTEIARVATEIRVYEAEAKRWQRKIASARKKLARLKRTNLD